MQLRGLSLKKQNEMKPTNYFRTAGPGPHLKPTNHFTKKWQYFSKLPQQPPLKPGILGLQMKKEFREDQDLYLPE